jgi:hypothetical protein
LIFPRRAASIARTPSISSAARTGKPLESWFRLFGKAKAYTWPDGSPVNVNFWDKGPAKSQVSIDHEKLPDAASAAPSKARWKEALARLSALLAPQP